MGVWYRCFGFMEFGKIKFWIWIPWILKKKIEFGNLGGI